MKRQVLKSRNVLLSWCLSGPSHKAWIFYFPLLSLSRGTCCIQLFTLSSFVSSQFALIFVSSWLMVSRHSHECMFWCFLWHVHSVCPPVQLCSLMLQVTQFKKLILECGSDPMSSSSRLPVKWLLLDFARIWRFIRSLMPAVVHVFFALGGVIALIKFQLKFYIVHMSSSVNILYNW